MEKLKVYIHSFELPTVGFVDKEGAMHACAQAQKTAFEKLGSFSSMLGNRHVSDEDRIVLMQVEGFCRNNNLEFEVVDLGTMSLLAKLRLRMKGLKTPAVGCGEKIFSGVPNGKDLRELLKS